ncbi:MAG: phosphoadenosine phosphosulfate reductase family protein [Pseudodesulfovibrio sp.]|nr:phosphoadenosine phosphosulfate reductase family protein [Pseudodesulfovibrio sp.]
MGNLVVSFSGGKDSTALLLRLLELGEDVHSAVFFDTGWEFPQMYDHIAKVEEYTGMEIVTLKPSCSFDYHLYDRPVQRRKKGDTQNGQYYKFGYGWPQMGSNGRWCTRIKINATSQYAKTHDATEAIGFASDESERCHSEEVKGRDCVFPMVEWGMTEADALAYCMERGFTWGGLYEHFDRVSCYCCPLKGSPRQWQLIREHYPEQWAEMLRKDAAIDNNRGFYGFKTVHELEAWFAYSGSLMAHAV